jgi:histidine ammonia-lyase
LIVSCQGVQLRLRLGTLSLQNFHPALQQCLERTEILSPFLEQDRPLEHELRQLVQAIRDEYWELYG